MDASGGTVLADRDQRRHCFTADIDAFHASGLERAAGRQVRKRRHGPVNGVKPLAAYAAGGGLQASDPRQ